MILTNQYHADKGALAFEVSTSNITLESVSRTIGHVLISDIDLNSKIPSYSARNSETTLEHIP